MGRSANRRPRAARIARRRLHGMMTPAIGRESRMSKGRGSGVGDRMTVNGIELEVLRRGAGTPILLLHGMDTVHKQTRFLDLLGNHAEIMLMGLSFGGWLAAEVAVARPHRLTKLVLLDPLGIKIGDRESRDILDVFNVNPAEVRRCCWHDEANAPDYDEMSDEELVIHARNWESLCLYAWHPYMYNPQLKQWLGRIAVPTLMLWGDSDRIVTADYGRAYAGLIPGAHFQLIEAAGHHPEIEQPERFVEQVAAFLKE